MALSQPYEGNFAVDGAIRLFLTTSFATVYASDDWSRSRFRAGSVLALLAFCAVLSRRTDWPEHTPITTTSLSNIIKIAPLPHNLWNPLICP